MRLTIPQHQLTLSGNTAGALSNLSSGTVTLAGGNNITLSQVGNAVTISGAAAGGAQTAISGLANSQTTYTSGTVSLSELGALTIRSSAGQIFQFEVPATSSLSATGIVSIVTNGSTVSIGAPAQSTQVETQTFIAGISASDTLYTSGNVRLTGVGGGVTVSSNTGQRVDISVAAQSVQTQNAVNMTLSGNTAGALALVSSGTLTLAGGSNITLSQAGNAVSIHAPASSSLSATGAVSISVNGSTISIGAPNQSVQPETQTFIAGVSASDTLYTSGNVRITGVGGGITVSSNTGQRVDLSVAAQTNQSGGVYASSNTFGTSSGTYDARSISIAGRGAASVAASNSGWIISVPAQSTQVETQTFLGGAAASNTTYTSGTFTITGVGGGVTVSSNTGQRIDISVAAPVAQSTQTQGILSVGVSTGGNTVGNTQVSTGSRFVLVASGNATASQATAAGASTITISVGTQTVQTQNMVAVTLSGNTSGAQALISSGTLTLAGGNNITVSQAGNAVTISAPNLGAGAMSAGVSTGGNTAGATGITGTQLVLVGSNNITLSQTTGANGGTVSINAPNSSLLVASAPLSLSTAGSTISIQAPATSSLSATGAVEISTNGSTISIGVPAIRTMGDWQNFPMALGVLMTHVASISKTPFYWNNELPARITANNFVVRLSAVTTATRQSFSIHAGIYTFVNSTSAALLGSWSEAYDLSTASSASWSGVRNYVMTGIGTHANLSLLTGGDYMFGLMFSAGAAGSMAQSLYGAGSVAGPLGRIVPGVNQASTGTSQGVMQLHGRGSTTVNALPANVVASEIVNQGSGASMQLHPWIYIRS